MRVISTEPANIVLLGCNTFVGYRLEYIQTEYYGQTTDAQSVKTHRNASPTLDIFLCNIQFRTLFQQVSSDYVCVSLQIYMILEGKVLVLLFSMLDGIPVLWSWFNFTDSTENLRIPLEDK